MTSTKNYSTELARNKKIKCPDCGCKTYVPYVVAGTKDIFNELVGKCDRAANCGRHYSPAQYRTEYAQDSHVKPIIEQVPYVAPKPLQYIPHEVFIKSLTNYNDNTFTSWLVSLFNKKVVSNVIDTYKIGTSASRWPGACVFWFITASGRVKAGQIKKFDSTGHTASYYSKKAGKEKKCTEWAHTAIKYKYENAIEPLPQWLADYIDAGRYCVTLYGEHLINLPENKSKIIALCEAPKTAIIGSIYLPQYVWLATSALDYFTEERIRVLAGRDVMLFPDLSISDNEPGNPYGRVYYKWEKRGLCYSHIANFQMSDILEKVATNEDRIKGLDLCDYLTRIPYKEALADEFKMALLSGIPEVEQIAKRNELIGRGADKEIIMQVINDLISNHGFVIE